MRWAPARTFFAAATWIALANACGPSAGGQSGTDGDVLSTCPQSGTYVSAGSAAETPGTGAHLRREVQDVLSLRFMTPLFWTPEVGGETTLAIEVTWSAEALENDRLLPCGNTPLPPLDATLRLFTADGLLDERWDGAWSATQLGARFTGGQEDPAALAASDLGQLLAERFGRADLGLERLAVTVDVVGSRLVGTLSVTTSLEDAETSAALEALAEFDSSAIAVPTEQTYVPPASFAQACATAQPTEAGFRSFESDEALRSALTGTWLLCASTSLGAVPHDGIALASDGTWTHLTETDGDLVEQLGFGHEGTFVVIDTSAMNGPNARQLNLERTSQDYGFSSDGNTLRLATAGGGVRYDDTYVRTDRAVGPPELAFDRGERAGPEACGAGEAFVHGFASTDALGALLTGSWAICSGGLRAGASGIEFAADGTYRHLDAAGAPTMAGRYQLLDTSAMNGPGAMQLNMTDADARSYVSHPLASEAPLKLWLHAGAPIVLSAEP